MPKWNHNLQYHPLILRAIPPKARTALDVGTGDGLLAVDLLRHVPSVTAIDVDPDAVGRARELSGNISWLIGDAMTYHFAPASFDVVASVAALHHLGDPADALRRLADLTAPGGVVAVLGLAKSRGPRDRAYDAAGLVRHRMYARHRGYWEHGSAVKDPEHSYAQVRRAAETVLPGCSFDRHSLFRYSVVWRKF